MEGRKAPTESKGKIHKRPAAQVCKETEKVKMTDKLISVVMPTSSRQHTHDSLVRALRSIKDTATDFSKIELCLRIDDDDKKRIDRIPELEGQFNVKSFIGPRFDGYNSMCVFLDDLAKIATGRWSWLFDDDAYIEGDWQKPLESIPCSDDGPAVNAEFYCLGLSRYSNWPKCSPPGLIMPTSVIKRLQHRSPVDD